MESFPIGQLLHEVTPVCTFLSTAYYGTSLSLHYRSPFLLLQLIITLEKKLLTSTIKTEKLFWKTSSSPHSVLPVFLLSFLTTYHPAFFASLLRLGVCKGFLLLFLWLATAAKGYQHDRCWQLWLCDRLWTILTYLHLTSNTSTAAQKPPISDCQLLMEQNLPLRRDQALPHPQRKTT